MNRRIKKPTIRMKKLSPSSSRPTPSDASSSGSTSLSLSSSGGASDLDDLRSVSFSRQLSVSDEEEDQAEAKHKPHQLAASFAEAEEEEEEDEEENSDQEFEYSRSPRQFTQKEHRRSSWGAPQAPTDTVVKIGTFGGVPVASEFESREDHAQTQGQHRKRGSLSGLTLKRAASVARKKLSSMKSLTHNIAQGAAKPCVSCDAVVTRGQTTRCGKCARRTCTLCTTTRGVQKELVCQQCYVDHRFLFHNCQSCGKPFTDSTSFSRCPKCKQRVCCVAEATVYSGEASPGKAKRMCTLCAFSSTSDSGSESSRGRDKEDKKPRSASDAPAVRKRSLSVSSIRTSIRKFTSKEDRDKKHGESETPTDSIFGMSLNEDEPIPEIVTTCLEFLLIHAPETEGIFRIAASTSKVAVLRELFDSGGPVDLNGSDVDVHAVGAILKIWFRELSEPVITEDLYLRACECNSREDLEALRSVMGPLRWSLLSDLCRFLKRVSLAVDVTKMDVANLSVVWSPNLMVTPESLSLTVVDLYSASKKETLFLIYCINTLGAPEAVDLKPAPDVALDADPTPSLFSTDDEDDAEPAAFTAAAPRPVLVVPEETRGPEGSLHQLHASSLFNDDHISTLATDFFGDAPNIVIDVDESVTPTIKISLDDVPVVEVLEANSDHQDDYSMSDDDDGSEIVLKEPEALSGEDKAAREAALIAKKPPPTLFSPRIGEFSDDDSLDAADEKAAAKIIGVAEEEEEEEEVLAVGPQNDKAGSARFGWGGGAPVEKRKPPPLPAKIPRSIKPAGWLNNTVGAVVQHVDNRDDETIKSANELDKTVPATVHATEVPPPLPSNASKRSLQVGHLTALSDSDSSYEEI